MKSFCFFLFFSFAVTSAVDPVPGVASASGVGSAPGVGLAQCVVPAPGAGSVPGVGLASGVGLAQRVVLAQRAASAVGSASNIASAPSSSPVPGVGSADNIIHICFVSDEKYMKPTTIALASVLKNAAKDDNFHFYIIDMGISKMSKAKVLALKRLKDFEIDFLSINDGRIKLIPLDGRKRTRRLGKAAYGRIFLGDLLPHLDKILYLDGDIMVRGSLKELWRTDIKNYYLAAVPDYICCLKMRDYIDFILAYKNKDSNRAYFNSGVLLMNLKKFRDEKIPGKIFKRIFELFKRGKLLAYDQDVLNNLLGFATKFLDLKFNYLTNYNDMEKAYSKAALIVHFSGEESKIWDAFNVVVDDIFAREYFEAQKTTAYFKFRDTFRQYWVLYIFNPFVRISIAINHFCEGFFR